MIRLINLPLTCFILSIFVSSKVWCQIPTHSKGPKYKIASEEFNGKGQIDQFYIYNSSYKVVYFRDYDFTRTANEYQSSGSHYQMDTTRNSLYLSENETYHVRVKMSNPDNSIERNTFSLWIKNDLDSVFQEVIIEKIFRDKIYPSDEGGFSFKLPLLDSTSSFTMRLRSSIYEKNGKMYPSDAYEYGETFDFRGRRFSRRDLEIDFSVPDTVFTTSIFHVLDPNPFSDLVKTWKLNNSVISKFNFPLRIDSTGNHEITLVVKDTLNIFVDSLTKIVVAKRADQKPVPQFTVDKENLQLFEELKLYDYSQNFVNANQYMITNGKDTFKSCIWYNNNCRLRGSINGYLYSTTVLTGNYLGAVGKGSWDVCMRSLNDFDSTDWLCKERVFYVNSDTTKPTIQLNGNTDTIINVYSNYLEEGYYAYDDNLGIINHRVDISSTLDTAQIGDYRITYLFSDLAGNQESTERVIRVRDMESPSIINNKANKDSTCWYIEVPYLDSFIDYTVFQDNYDLSDLDIDITPSDSLGNSLVNTKLLGKTRVDYIVQDSSGNEAKQCIVYEVKDMRPVMKLPSDTVVAVFASFDLLNSVSAWDEVDQDLTDSINFNGTYDTAKVGLYKLTFEVTNSRGFTVYDTMRLTIVDTVRPTLTSRHNTNGYEVKLFTDFDGIDQIKIEDNYDDSAYLYNRIDTVYNDLNLDAEGLYSQVFRVKDSSGNWSKGYTHYIQVKRVLVTNTLEGITRSVKPNPVLSRVQIKMGSDIQNVQLTLFNSLGEQLNVSQQKVALISCRWI